MNDFDDELGTGGGYERVIRITLYDPDGVPRRIVLRMRGLSRQPGWPEPSSIVKFFDHVETRRRAAYAREQIQMRYPHWDAELFWQGIR